MEINNFKLLAKKLIFDSDDEFYFLQILQRPKDGHNISGSNKNRLIKYYLIKSQESLAKYEKEIIGLCNLYNARAYIHPTKRSFKAVSRKYCLNVTENVVNEHYHLSGKEFPTACGQSYIATDKKYIIDIDTHSEEIKNTVIELIKNNTVFPRINPVYIVPTLNGNHIICKPFNTYRFNQDLQMVLKMQVEIHKNNPTVLYYNKK